MKYLLALILCINSLSAMGGGNSGVVHYFVGMQGQADGGSNRLALNPQFKDADTPISADRIEIIRGYFHHIEAAEQLLCEWLGIERLEDLTWGALPAEKDIKESARRCELTAMLALVWNAQQEQKMPRLKKEATQAPPKDCLEGKDLRHILGQIVTNQYHLSTIECERYLSLIPELTHFYTTRSSFEGLSEKEKKNKLKELSWPQLKERLDVLIAGKNLQQWLGNEVTGLTAFGYSPDGTSYPELGLGDIGSNGRFKKEVCEQ